MMSRYSVYLASLFSLMILSRIFTPSDYGLISSIMVFITFIQMLSEQGITATIINKNNIDKVELDGQFSLMTVLGIFFALLTAFALIFSNIHQDINGSKLVILIMFSSVPFYAATVLPTSILLRDKLFKQIAIATLISEIIATFITILLSFLIKPTYALAAKITIYSMILYLIIMQYSSKAEFGRPRFIIKHIRYTSIYKYSFHQFGFNLMNFFSRNLDNFLVGKYFGATSLGIYSKAYQLMMYPLMLITHSITPAIQPALREYSDLKTVIRLHESLVLKLSVIGAISGLIVFKLNFLIVSIILGDQWDGVSVVLKILAISIPIQVVLSSSGSFFQATNTTNYMFYNGAISTTIFITAIIYGIVLGSLTGLSWLLVAAFSVNFLITYTILYNKIFKSSVWSFAIKTSPIYASSIYMLIDLL